MTRISRSNAYLPVPVRAKSARGASGAVVNPIAAISADRRSEGADWQVGKKPLRSRPAHQASTNRVSMDGQLLAGLHGMGAEERRRSAPGAYEAVSRYEDRYFGEAPAGMIRQASA